MDTQTAPPLNPAEQQELATAVARLEREELRDDYDLPELAETYEEAHARMVADRYLKAAAALDAERQHIIDATNAEVGYLRHRQAQALERLERRRGWLAEGLIRLAAFFTFPPQRKSLELPHGRIGFKRKPAKLEQLDPKRIIEWATLHAPDVLETVTSTKLVHERLVKVVEVNPADPIITSLLDSGAARWHNVRDEFYFTPTERAT